MMPRKRSFWNNLPRKVFTGEEDADGYEVLAAWGVEAWGSKLPSDIGDYVGWQRVHLPEGWTVSLEGHDFYLIDQQGQVRGEIQGAFESPKRNRVTITDEVIQAAGITKKEFEEVFGSSSKKQVSGPRLKLRSSISFRNSFCLGDKGPHSYWAENAFGQVIYGIIDQEISPDALDERMSKLQNKVIEWVNEHYPEWRRYDAYWDTFVQIEERWRLTEHEIRMAAVALTGDKSDDELQALLDEMGKGEKRTEYIVHLQKTLAEIFELQDDVSPFHIASNVAWLMELEIRQRFGRAED